MVAILMLGTRDIHIMRVKMDYLWPLYVVCLLHAVILDCSGDSAYDSLPTAATTKQHLLH